jgi:glutathione S-transferase
MARDLTAIQKTMAEEYPVMMDQLERWAPGTGFTLGAAPGLADFSVVSHFANLRWARQVIDAARWPRASAWINRVEQQSPLQQLNAVGEKLLRAPLDGHRPILQALGIAVSAETVGGSTPRRGPMTAI